jgi:hypothetical protein
MDAGMAVGMNADAIARLLPGYRPDGVGIYIPARNILFTAYPHSWWQGMAAD